MGAFDGFWVPHHGTIQSGSDSGSAVLGRHPPSPIVYRCQGSRSNRKCACCLANNLNTVEEVQAFLKAMDEDDG